VIQNPTAGFGRAGDVSVALGRALRAAGVEVVDLSAGRMALALDAAREALRHGLDALAVIGGDGMVHLGAQAVAGSATPLMILPAGTGNDFAAAAGIGDIGKAPCSAAVTELLSSPPRRVDLLRVRGEGICIDGGDVRWVAGAVSAGLDAAVNARANAMRFPRGARRYAVAAIAEIATYRAWSYRVRLEDAVLATGPGLPGLERTAAGATWVGDAALVTLANSPQIGGGIPVAPGASLTDGRMDVVIAGDVGRAGAARLFPRLLRGAHVHAPDVMVLRSARVRLESAGGRSVALYGDGEFLGAPPVDVEVVPGALRVLA